MKRNAAGQVVGAQMINAADGTPFTGAGTVYVTGDGGTQAVGSVSSGATTHKGNGYHEYAPAQAETDYAHPAFTFTGTGAIPVTIQIYTNPSVAELILALVEGLQDAHSVYRGTVTGSTSTTTLIDSGLTQSANDHWKGRILIFRTGALAGQATNITAFDAATDQLTFTALTSAPGAGDEYVIL